MGKILKDVEFNSKNSIFTKRIEKIKGILLTSSYVDGDGEEQVANYIKRCIISGKNKATLPNYIISNKGVIYRINDTKCTNFCKQRLYSDFAIKKFSEVTSIFDDKVTPHDRTIDENVISICTMSEKDPKGGSIDTGAMSKECYETLISLCTYICCENELKENDVCNLSKIPANLDVANSIGHKYFINGKNNYLKFLMVLSHKIISDKYTYKTNIVKVDKILNV